jgi:hypothetical protein
MSIEVRFACGHKSAIGVNVDTAPVCRCGETRIVRTFARAPRFTGAVSGPYAETRAMEPGVVDVAPGGALRLKESSDG